MLPIWVSKIKHEWINTLDWSETCKLWKINLNKISHYTVIASKASHFIYSIHIYQSFYLVHYHVWRLFPLVFLFSLCLSKLVLGTFTDNKSMNYVLALLLAVSFKSFHCMNGCECSNVKSKTDITFSLFKYCFLYLEA